MKLRFFVRLFLLCIVILICTFFAIHETSVHAQGKGTAEPSSVVPTLYCLGSCPSTVPTVPAVATKGPTSSPLSTATSTHPSVNPATAVNPCTGQTSAHSFKEHRKRGGGFLSNFFELIFKLLEMLLGLIGVQLPNPVTTPILPTPSQTVIPSTAPSPSSVPVPCPSKAASPSIALSVAPTTQIQPSVAQTQQCPTTAGQASVTIDGKSAPNPLTLKNGNAVTCVPLWENQRRAEILADFRQNVYGVLPAIKSQSFAVQSTVVGNVTRKIVTVSIVGPQGSGSFPFKLFIPKTGSKPLGTFVMLNHRGASSDDPAQTGGYMPVATITAAGYALAVVDAGDTAPDDPGSYASKALTWFYGSNIPSNGSKAVGVWAWSASRIMDYLATDPDIDVSKVAVIGHSRSGKASLWAGAQDTRFAAVISNDSGNTGAKFARRSNVGENVAAINGSFPYWFPETYKAFAGKESSLPVDQHELISLVAPRRVLVGSADGDDTSDPQGEFISYIAASEVYKLYGIGNNGLPSATWPPATDKDFRGDAMSYHLRSGAHDLDATDWGIYLNGNIFQRTAPTNK